MIDISYDVSQPHSAILDWFRDLRQDADVQKYFDLCLRSTICDAVVLFTVWRNLRFLK